MILWRSKSPNKAMAEEEQYLVFSPAIRSDDPGIKVTCSFHEPVEGHAYMKTGEMWPAELLLRSLQHFIEDCKKNGVSPIVAMGPLKL